MKKQLLHALAFLAFVAILIVSCQKDNSKTSASQNLTDEKGSLSTRQGNLSNPPYDLNVILRGACSSTSAERDADGESGDCPVGHLKFLQDPDIAKIIDLDISVHNLLSNHEYLLQRAVDPINVVDGNCTSINWLTLGKGLTPQSIFTDNEGNGKESLWRDATAIPSGSKFDIHFQVIDAVTKDVILTSDCFQYQVR